MPASKTCSAAPLTPGRIIVHREIPVSRSIPPAGAARQPRTASPAWQAGGRTDGSSPRIPGLAVVAAVYGGQHELRRQGAITCFNELASQSHQAQHTLVLELLLPGQYPMLHPTDLPAWVEYRRIFGRKHNRFLFQKEALYNIAWRLLGDCDRFIFLDADFVFAAQDWLVRADALIVPGTASQPWSKMTENKAEDYNRSRYSLCTPPDAVAGADKSWTRCPGGCWGLHRSDLEDMDGFNVWGVTGSGDALFVWERMGCLGYANATEKTRHFQSLIRRGLKPLKSAFLPVPVTHIWHGSFASRSYYPSRRVLDIWGLPQSYLHVDSQGLLAWNDPECLLAYIISDKTRMSDPTPGTCVQLIRYIAEAAQEQLERLDSGVIPAGSAGDLELGTWRPVFLLPTSQDEWMQILHEQEESGAHEDDSAFNPDGTGAHLVEVENPAVALGRKGGKAKTPAKSEAAKKRANRGLAKGRAKLAKLTPEQRSENARKAALARWAKTQEE